MGIELWQSRLPLASFARLNSEISPELITEQSPDKSPEKSIQETAPEYRTIAAPPAAVSTTVQPPLLVAQLERALAYCQQQTNETNETNETRQSSTLSWLIDDSKTEIIREQNQLTLPNLTQVFASASLKRQLWQLISHTSEK